jgi:hypothetical protein|tara:strand:+ start:54 stop:224 length:171 start_codon:yes stop_codon:yes gene_type:complete
MDELENEIELLYLLFKDDNWKTNFRNEKEFKRFLNNTAWSIVNKTREEEEELSWLR